MHAIARPDERLPRERVLRRRTDFLLVKEKGRRVRGRFLSLNWLVPQGGLQEERSPEGRMFGVIVPKAVGNAVERNAVKRWVREAYRRIQGRVAGGCWSIWIARREASGAGYEAIRTDVLAVYRRAGLIGRDDV